MIARGAAPARMPVSLLDEMHEASAGVLLLDACGSREWVRRMIDRRPFVTLSRVFEAADEEWGKLQPEDWLEAFRAHPRIGQGRIAGQSAASARMSESEQSAFVASDTPDRAGISRLNDEYAQRFGYIFIVCATGRTAAEIEAQLRSRITNPPEHELRVAAEEQRRITRLRLERGLEEG